VPPRFDSHYSYCFDDFILMARPYGKTPRGNRSSSSAAKKESDALKIHIRAKDDAALTIPELQQGLQEAARKLASCKGLRAKRATIYVSLMDGDGDPARVNDKNEWIIRLYKSAAEEHGV
jgi:hypothetical protein